MNLKKIILSLEEIYKRVSLLVISEPDEVKRQKLNEIAALTRCTIYILEEGSNDNFLKAKTLVSLIVKELARFGIKGILESL